MFNAGFELEITELRLGLPTRPSCEQGEAKNDKKRVYLEIGSNDSGGGGGSGGRNEKLSVASIGSEKDYCLETAKRLVKISMDGVPFLRKIDLSCYQEYHDFVAAIENLFDCPDNCEYAPIYEDKDGDWLLVGDVPWNIFVDSCKKLRIIKRAYAKGFNL